ncbi:MAG: hypothetical protein IJT36_01955 [Alphaproteobacteria bacterium]|nr:hypothetical protein [Alphaproteobacteria bacterium]
MFRFIIITAFFGITAFCYSMQFQEQLPAPSPIVRYQTIHNILPKKPLTIDQLKQELYISAAIRENSIKRFCCRLNMAISTGKNFIYDQGEDRSIFKETNSKFITNLKLWKEHTKNITTPIILATIKETEKYCKSPKEKFHLGDIIMEKGTIYPKNLKSPWAITAIHPASNFIDANTIDRIVKENFCAQAIKSDLALNMDGSDIISDLESAEIESARILNIILSIYNIVDSSR